MFVHMYDQVYICSGKGGGRGGGVFSGVVVDKKKSHLYLYVKIMEKFSCTCII